MARARRGTGRAEAARRTGEGTSVRRFGRYLVLLAVWYVLLFFAVDAAWHHFAHHPIPAWASDVRFGLWIYVVIRDKIPGYKWFVSDRAPKSNMVPEIPTGPLVGWRAWRIGNGTSGRTQVHETGWRSQYAKPLALVRPRILTPKIRRRLDLILEGLSKEYGVT